MYLSVIVPPEITARSISSSVHPYKEVCGGDIIGHVELTAFGIIVHELVNHRAARPNSDRLCVFVQSRYTAHYLICATSDLIACSKHCCQDKSSVNGCLAADNLLQVGIAAKLLINLGNPCVECLFNIIAHHDKAVLEVVVLDVEVGYIVVNRGYLVGSQIAFLVEKGIDIVNEFAVCAALSACICDCSVRRKRCTAHKVGICSSKVCAHVCGYLVVYGLIVYSKVGVGVYHVHTFLLNLHKCLSNVSLLRCGDNSVTKSGQCYVGKCIKALTQFGNVSLQITYLGKSLICFAIVRVLGSLLPMGNIKLSTRSLACLASENFV